MERLVFAASSLKKALWLPRFAFALGLMTAGCSWEWSGPHDVVVRERSESPDGSDAGSDAGSDVPWGLYTQALDVPKCSASAPVLVVDTADDELDGTMGVSDRSQAGAKLSLREALWIAFNRPGADTIYFDGAVFPAERPATINFGKNLTFPGSIWDLCLDGRGRGVVLDWPEDTLFSIWGLGPNSLQVGLTLLRVAGEQSVSEAQLAGCRIATDGQIGVTPHFMFSVLGAGINSVIGPGNVFSAYAPIIVGMENVVRENWFGVDPLTRRLLGQRWQPTIRVSGSMKISGNVFEAASFEPLYPAGPTRVIFEGNFVGVDPQGGPLPAAGGLSGLNAETWVSYLVRENVIRGAAVGVLVGDAKVTLLRNEVTQNQIGIAFENAAPVNPPTITRADSGGVEVTCPVIGSIELFADEGDQGRLFLGVTSCDPTDVLRWPIDLTDPRLKGLNLTATLTDSTFRTSAFSPPVPVR